MSLRGKMIDLADPKTDVEDLYKQFKATQYKNKYYPHVTTMTDWLAYRYNIDCSFNPTDGYYEECEKQAIFLSSVWEKLGFIEKIPNGSLDGYFRFLK